MKDSKVWYLVGCTFIIAGGLFMGFVTLADNFLDAQPLMSNDPLFGITFLGVIAYLSGMVFFAIGTIHSKLEGIIQSVNSLNNNESVQD